MNVKIEDIAKAPQLYARLYRAHGGGWELIITNSVGRDYTYRREYGVDGKKTARRIAAEHNAICWNF
jgi:hypothetical protein